MKRSRFLKKIGGYGLIPPVGLKACDSADVQDADRTKNELVTAWSRSAEMTLANMEQMPPEFYTFRYTEEAMTFSEQWRHCAIYTCGQLASRIGKANPYKEVKLPVQMA